VNEGGIVIAMNIFQAFVLGLLQGATEFIPVSSSGHLTLVPWLLDWRFDPVLKNAFDVLTHWGTLVAVLTVFWSDLWSLFLGGLDTLRGLSGRGIRGILSGIGADVQGRLAWLIVLGSIPAAVLGLLLEGFFEEMFGAPRIVSILLLVTAGLLAFSEWRSKRGRDLNSLNWLDALLIGLGQATAIAPGISRSGATIASGLLRGVKREAAARFSFLLSTPVIVGAGVWQLKDLLVGSEWTAHLAPLAVGFAASAVVGYACIRFLLKYLRQGKLYSFAIYCAFAGTACLVITFLR
jgi:undecaprenyl-diphosphatase